MREGEADTVVSLTKCSSCSSSIYWADPASLGPQGWAASRCCHFYTACGPEVRSWSKERSARLNVREGPVLTQLSFMTDFLYSEDKVLSSVLSSFSKMLVLPVKNAFSLSN